MKKVLTLCIAKFFFVIFLVLATTIGYGQDARPGIDLGVPCTVITPGLVSGPANVCPFINTAVQLTYSIDALPQADSYTWTVPPTVTLVSGQGTTSIMVTINSGFIQSANKVIKVRANFPCGVSTDRLFYLKAQAPGTPQQIIPGSTNVCAFVGTGNAISYSVPPVPGASLYTWSTPPGTSVSHPNGSGPNDFQILVTFLPGFSGGNITVQTSNDCGTSSFRSYTIQTNLPPRPGLISGGTNVCENIAPLGTPRTFSVSPVSGATLYNWTAPGGSVITHPNGTGANDFSITVLFPADFTSGSVTVAAANGCGASDARSLSVNILRPSAPGGISSTVISNCPDRVNNYSVQALPANSNSIEWAVPDGGTILTGQGTTSITVSFLSTAINGAVSATGVSNCGRSHTRLLSVHLLDCSEIPPPPPPPPTPFARNFSNNLNVQPVPDKMTLMVSPNPSVNDFKVQVLTAGKEIINVRILDVSGRVLRKLTVMPYETITFGNELKAGTYMIESTQGEFRKIQKLIKF